MSDSDGDSIEIIDNLEEYKEDENLMIKLGIKKAEVEVDVSLLNDKQRAEYDQELQEQKENKAEADLLV